MAMITDSIDFNSSEQIQIKAGLTSAECVACNSLFFYRRGRRGVPRTICSSECRKVRQKITKAKIRKTKSPELISASCKICSKPFEYTPLRSGRRRKLCSLPCKREYKVLANKADRAAGKRKPYTDAYNKSKRESAPLRTWECKFCGDSFQSKSLHVRTTCSIVCGNAIRRLASSKSPELIWQNRRRRHAKAAQRRIAWMKGGAEYENFSRLEIFERDSWRCGLCGEHIDRKLKFPARGSASVDHIVPLSRGGSHTRANVQAAHFGCNSKKQNKVQHG